MKIQNKEVVLNFKTAADYDLLVCREKGLRGIFAVASGIRQEVSRLEKKFGKKSDDLTDEERGEFNMPLNFAEIFLLAQATLGLSEDEVARLMEKELDTRSVIEIGMDFVNELMSSKVFVAAKIQAEDENPKQPK
jgi:hypothetical protein